MSLDTWKFIIFPFLGLLFALLTGIKTWHELIRLHNIYRREQAKFAVETGEKLNDTQLKKYGNELAYASLVGDRHLTHEQRKFLLGRDDAEKIISKMMRTRRLISIHAEERKISWNKSKHASSARRTFEKIFSYFAYCFLCFLPTLPMLVWGFRHPSEAVPASQFEAMLVFVALFFVPAFYFLLHGVTLGIAEDLMASVNSETPRAPAAKFLRIRRRDQAQ